MNERTGRSNALPKVIPERIREAREARGYSLDTFASALGITRQAVAQFETGQNGPSAETLSKIIALTAQPPRFFTNPRRRKANTTSSPYWRSMKRMDSSDRSRITRRLEWAADIVDYIEGYIALPAVSVPDLQWDCDTGSDEDIEEIALRVRSEWSVGYGPIHDLVKLLEANGVVLILDRVECEDMDAVSRWQTGRPYILYSKEVESAARVNFNLAHELGHLLLHGGIEVSSENLPKLERQANRFAGAFLLPRSTFSSEVLSTSLTYFEHLKKRWHVAIAAMVYRCKDLGILNESQVKYLWRQMNSLGIRRREPLDREILHEKPSVIRAALEMLVAHQVQNKSEIEQAINLNPTDIEALGGMEQSWLTADRVVAFKPAFKQR